PSHRPDVAANRPGRHRCLAHRPPGRRRYAGARHALLLPRPLLAVPDPGDGSSGHSRPACAHRPAGASDHAVSRSSNGGDPASRLVFPLPVSAAEAWTPGDHGNRDPDGCSPGAPRLADHRLSTRSSARAATWLAILAGAGAECNHWNTMVGRPGSSWTLDLMGAARPRCLYPVGLQRLRLRGLRRFRRTRGADLGWTHAR